MERAGRAVLSCVLCVVLGQSAVLCGSSELADEGAFTIQHEGSGRCLQAQRGSPSLGNCSAEPAFLWKWGSGRRLFHVGSSACLGMDVPTKTLRVSGCTAAPELQWTCLEGSLHTTYQMRLSATANGSVVAKREAPDSWVRGGTSESICQQTYRVVHTSGGNSNGAPCRFPFLYKGAWHHGCLPADELRPLAWCSTTESYEEDRRWGTCLRYEEGCGALWNISRNGRCIQVVSSAFVTWHEARDSCRTQGGDLLSVSSSEDLRVFKAGSDLPEKLWMGLNRLDWFQGWQWSDGSPLAYIPWNADAPPLKYYLQSTDCGVLHPNMQFSGESCEENLPYICEKMENSTQTPPEATDNLVYKPTICEPGWLPRGGFCYKLFGNELREYKTYEDAQSECVENKAQLASLHSLDDIQLLNTEFSNVSSMWIGLKAVKSTDQFRWEDGSNVTFTYWMRTQPPLLSRNADSCVTLEAPQEQQYWFVVPCNSSSPFLCKKPGTVNQSAEDQGCPQDGGWRRHGNSCYKIDTLNVSYKNSCKLTISNRFEQAFINSLLREHISNEPLSFWTGLQDSKGTGEYKWFSPSEQEDWVTYTNWRWQEPVNSGGCAVMSTARPLGQWFVKNCTVYKAGSICKRPVSSVPPTPPPHEPDVHTPCPPGWVSKEGMMYCYKVFHEERVSRKRSWDEAERFCEALGAHLPSFTQVEEMTQFHYILRDSVSDDRFFWVGLNRRNPNTEYSWEWSDGRPVTMTMFPQEFHEDDDYNRDCTAFKSLKENYRLLFFFLLHDLPIRPFYPAAFHCDAKLEWVCQIPRGRTPKNPEWYNPDGHHGTSVFMDGQEFWFVTEPTLSFEEASMYCSSNSSRLAVPRSISAARHLHEHLFKNSGSPKAKWWTDFHMPGYLLPFRYPPSHYQSGFLARCPSVVGGSLMPDYRVPCETRLPFVCETLNVTSSETGTSDPETSAKPCEEGTLSFRDKCFTVIKPDYTSFKQANEKCLSLRGTLLSVRDQAEQDFITTLLPALPQRIWIGLKLKLHGPQWMDKSDVSYVNFNPLLHGQLRPMYINTFEQSGVEMCAFMFNDAHSDMLGTWDFTSCSDQQSVAICQHYTDNPELPVVSQDEFSVNNHTFKLVFKGNLTWSDAWELCKKNGMDLASVSDAYLQAVLTVNTSNVGHALWIGLFSEDEQHYHWTDGSHTVFSRWGQEVTAGRCVYLDTDGFWKATICEAQLRGAICHIPHESVQPPHETEPCPHRGNGVNWIPFNKNCYTFLLASQRWTEHDKGKDGNTCQALAGMGDVLTVRSEEENEFIREQLQPFRALADFVWLGIQQKGDQLKWYDDTNVQFSNWEGGRPSVPKMFLAGMDLKNGLWKLETESFQRFKQSAIVVCKIERDDKAEFRMNPENVTAPPGYAFRLVPKRLSWYQALEECGSDGGHLVSIHNETMNTDIALISKLDGFPLWVGLSRQDFSGWPFEWSDGTPLLFHPPGFQVRGVGSEEQCVYVDHNGLWSAVNCHAQLEGALCYAAANRSRTAAHSSDSCPKSDVQASWIQFEDHCYAIDMTLYNYSVYRMEEAQSICESLDPASQLLTIKSKEENDFVAQHVAENPLITNRVWLALKSAVGDSWMDGSALGFSNWVSAPPRAGCAVLVAVNGSWSSASCDESRSRVVCKTPAKSSGVPLALAFFVIVLLCLVAVVIFVMYKKTRQRFFSAVRYRRNFDEADSASMISESE